MGLRRHGQPPRCQLLALKPGLCLWLRIPYVSFSFQLSLQSLGTKKRLVPYDTRRSDIFPKGRAYAVALGVDDIDELVMSSAPAFLKISFARFSWSPS